MPELPECERGRQLAEAVLVGRRIDRVHCAEDSIVLDGTSPPAVRRALRGRCVVAAHRHGKHIWLETDARPWPVFHFGMTGSFRVPDATPLPLASAPNPSADGWPPRFVKLRLVLDDGSEFAFVNARRLGRLRLRRDPRSEPPIAKLGFDPLLDLPSPARFEELVRRRRGTLKGLLLDQKFAAGVGNWIADEVLYQARLDPRRRADSLDDGDIRQMRAKLRHVIRVAVDANAEKDRFPRGWLFHRRWGRREDARTVGGERIRHDTIAGRTTAWVPDLQK
jgi:formamidopyrimidine-DNA glycosylase